MVSALKVWSALLVLITSLTPILALAEPTLADYGNLPTTQMLAISPSGKLIAFRRTTADADHVVVYSLEQKKYLRMTDVTAVSPRQIYFISDNHVILVASEFKKISGFRGEFDVSTAYVLDIQAGGVRQLLTPGDKIYRGQSGLGRITGISSDKRYLYMPALVGRSNSDHRPDLFLMKVNIKSPRGPRVLSNGRRNAIDYFTNANDKVLALETYNNRSNIHQVLANHDGDWVSVFEDEAEVLNVRFSGVTPDESSLVMLVENQNTGRVSYSSLSLADGAIIENLFSRPDADVESVLTDINKVAHGVVYSGFRPSYKFFDPVLDKRIQDIQALFPDQSVWLRDWSEDWKHLVVYVEGSMASGDFYLFIEGNDPVFLTGARPNIEQDDINPVVSISFAARDGLTIPTLLTVPRHRVDSLNNLPAIMMPHGGPQSHDRVQFDWLAQAIASQGYLVIQPQFRGSDGFGGDHIRAGHGEWGRKMQDDLTDSLKYLIEEGIVDESRVCTVGWSYGGYAALAGGAFTPELYRCVVSINGVSDLPGMLAFERRKHGKKHWIVSYFENFMVKGEATTDKLNAVSPINFAENFTAPVLLIHGENDEVVPFEQSNDLFKRLTSAGKDVRLIKQEDENHSMSTGENRLAGLQAVIEHINMHIGEDSGANGGGD